MSKLESPKSNHPHLIHLETQKYHHLSKYDFEFILDQLRDILGHSKVILGHPGFIMGHPDVILGLSWGYPGFILTLTQNVINHYNE